MEISLKRGAKKTLSSIRPCLLLLSLVSLLVPFNGSSAQADNSIVYDYVILVDTSGSMNDGTPPLFGQVQKVAQDFVTALQDGSNLAVYTFDTTYTEVGFWPNISASDKSQIVSQIGNWNANGQLTALWDAVCQGLTRLEEMGSTGGQHIQLLISYTDGKDNHSVNQPSTCLAKYQEIQKDGYTYWIYNAIGGVTVPDEVNELKDIIGIVKTDAPIPLQVVNILPLELELGNLFEKGKSSPDTACLVFWSSTPSILGKEISFNEPPTSDRNLPSGVAPQICGTGQSCPRTISVSNTKSCLTLELVNFSSQNVGPSETGKYTLTLPLQMPYTNPEDRVFLVPNKLKISFSLDYPPTPTPLPSATPTQPPTATPLPTATPTPLPTFSVIDCQGRSSFKEDIVISENEKQDLVRDFTCRIAWGKYTLPESAVLSINYDPNSKDNEFLFSYVWLVKGDLKSKNVGLEESDKEFIIRIEIPRSDWNKFDNGKKNFTGTLLLTPTNTSFVGDIDAKNQTIPIEFSVRKQLPAWILPAIIGSVLFLILLIIIPRIVQANKPPKFQSILSYEIDGRETRINLDLFKPEIISSKHVKLLVGQGPNCQIKLPANNDLGMDYFWLHAEKNPDGTEIQIEPLEFVRVNGMPISTIKSLKNSDVIQIDDMEIRILINTPI
jgi:hypothetical protein